jgi:hypothetical protein
MLNVPELYTIDMTRVLGRLVYQHARVVVTATSPREAMARANALARSPDSGIRWTSHEGTDKEWVEKSGFDEDLAREASKDRGWDRLSSGAYLIVFRAVERYVGPTIPESQKKKLITALLDFAEHQAHQAAQSTPAPRSPLGTVGVVVRTVLRPFAALSGWLSARRGRQAGEAVHALCATLAAARLTPDKTTDRVLRERVTKCLRLLLGREPRWREVEQATAAIPFSPGPAARGAADLVTVDGGGE